MSEEEVHLFSDMWDFVRGSAVGSGDLSKNTSKKALKMSWCEVFACVLL